MDTQPKYSADIYGLVAWANENRKRLLVALAILAAVGVITGVYFWHSNYQTDSAAAALDRIMGSDPAQFIEVANQYPTTTSAARALLIAGQLQFAAGKYDQAQATFQRFMAEHSDYGLVNQGAVGVAACLEAQGKAAEAAARYEEISRRPQDSTTIQAQAALARLYVVQGKNDQALRQYAALLQGGVNDSWHNEARVEVQDLLLKHPELRQKLAPPPAAAPGAMRDPSSPNPQ
jgi:predicted negative regulator of RcsB-dependent stress response